MNLKSIIKKLSAGEWHYAFGRFETVRRGYSAFRRMIGPLPLPPDVSATLFPATLKPESLENLRRDAVAFGFHLSPNMVKQITAFAKTASGIRRGDGVPFKYKNVIKGRLPDGSPIALGTILNAEQCPAISKIMADPGLLDLATRYLGYQPHSIKPWLFWSFVTAQTETERLQGGQTVLFHFDVDGLNFIYASFYLTNVDKKSGAHVMVKRSHRGKSLGMLFHSANQNDETVLHHFGAENLITIIGKAGTGFVQDSSCYHKALAPVTRERLMLQLRFS